MLAFIFTHWKISGIAFLVIAVFITWPILKWRIRKEERQKVYNEQDRQELQDDLEVKKIHETVNSSTDDANLDELCDEWVKKG